MNVRAMIRLAAMLSAAHLALSIGSLLLGYSASAGRSDSPASPSLVQLASSRIADVLIQPGHAIYKVVYPISEAPTGVQVLAVVLNSVLWGIFLGIGLVRARALIEAR